MRRLIAMYLPQFHPIPENDAWWGKGFTEWTNTGKAKPLFPGHYQPNVPADLGYYDLRVPETRAAQAALARANGIEAFMYYHYWFAGKRLLERPFNEVLASGEPDFPFCLCWANQSWTGVWHGAPGRMLVEQTYPGEDDHRRHFATLEPAFHDPRYVRVDGKPLFMIYNATNAAFMPIAHAVTDFWREMAQRSGLPGLYLMTESWHFNYDPRKGGFDALSDVLMPDRRPDWLPWSDPLRKIGNKIAHWRHRPTILRYEDVIAGLLPPPRPGITSYPCVVPRWDNTPRSGRGGRVFIGATPEKFRGHLRAALERVSDLPDQRQLVFVKSWNEWAEGNYLEPDLRYGHAFLDVVREETQRLYDPRRAMQLPGLSREPSAI